MADVGEILVQWNVQGLTTSKQDLVKVIHELEPIIIAVQETLQSEEYLSKLAEYSSISKTGHFNQRYHGGVALYIHNTLPYERLEINSSLQVVAARVQTGHQRLVNFASLYMPPSANVTIRQVQDAIDQIINPIVLMGDFNAHNVSWGKSNRLVSRRRMVEDIVTSQELNILNDGTPIHISSTSIDLTITSPTLSPDLQWTTIPSVLSSDYYPIVITLTPANRPLTYHEERYNFRKCN